MDTIGSPNFFSYSKVSLTLGPSVYFQYAYSWALQHNMAAFSEHSLPVHWWGRRSRGLYYE